MDVRWDLIIIVGPSIVRNISNVVFVENDIVSMFPNNPPKKIDKLEIGCDLLTSEYIIKKRVKVCAIIMEMEKFKLFKIMQ